MNMFRFLAEKSLIYLSKLEQPHQDNHVFDHGCKVWMVLEQNKQLEDATSSFWDTVIGIF